MRMLRTRTRLERVPVSLSRAIYNQTTSRRGYWGTGKVSPSVAHRGYQAVRAWLSRCLIQVSARLSETGICAEGCNNRCEYSVTDWSVRRHVGMYNSPVNEVRGAGSCCLAACVRTPGPRSAYRPHPPEHLSDHRLHPPEHSSACHLHPLEHLSAYHLHLACSVFSSDSVKLMGGVLVQSEKGSIFIYLHRRSQPQSG